VRVWDVEIGEQFVYRESHSTPSGYRAIRCAGYHNGITVVLEKHDGSLAIEMLSFTVPNKTTGLGFGNCTKRFILPDPDTPTLRLKFHIQRLAFSISGQSMVMTGDPRSGGRLSNEVTLCNVGDQTFQEGWRFSHDDGAGVESLSFSPDGRSLAICFVGNSSRVFVLNVETGQCVGQPTSKYALNCVAYSPDGRLLVAADRTTLVAWDARTYDEVIDPVHGNVGEIYEIWVSPDRKKIASMSGINTLCMWDLDSFITPRPPVSKVFHEDRDPVLSLAFSPCGKKLAASTGSTISVWDAATPSTSPDFFISLHDLTQLKLSNRRRLAYSPDGRYILCLIHDAGLSESTGLPESKLGIWVAETGKPSATYHRASATSHGSIKDIFFVASGSHWLLVAWYGYTTFKTWEEDGSEVENQVKFPLDFGTSTPYILALSPGTSRAFVAIGIQSDPASARGEVWCTKALERPPILLHGLPEELHLTTGLEGSFSSCGRLVAAHDLQGTIYIWDAETGVLIFRRIRMLNWRSVGRMCVAFSPNSNFIATGMAGSNTVIWNVRAGQVRTIGDGHTARVTHLTFSPDGSTLASSSWDGTIKLWNTSNLNERDQESKPVGGVPEVFGIKDGWAMGENDELLFWIPPDLRPGLWRPDNTMVISPGPTAKLDYTRFKYGRDWTKCCDGQQSD
jgi:WD40 repeat protein